MATNREKDSIIIIIVGDIIISIIVLVCSITMLSAKIRKLEDHINYLQGRVMSITTTLKSVGLEVPNDK